MQDAIYKMAITNKSKYLFKKKLAVDKLFTTYLILFS